ncbi:unnamed protein product [Linum trigynum]|uniref:Zinc knuckle CX2CX4HX4C domain-containing protein n=1 Tax=Linum trigynum TaxID=586398 RepID=A0AAV2E0T7_9ROSI
MDYKQAAMGGPWLIGNHYITVRAWRKGFDARSAEVATTRVWARFLELPVEFINREAVERIASRIGRPVCVDRAIVSGACTKFGRAFMEVDLTKPLLGQCKVEDKTYHVEYEGLDNICTECGMYGHSKTSCPTLRKQAREHRLSHHLPP